MVLIEEAKAGGTPRPEWPRDDQGIQSLAGGGGGGGSSAVGPMGPVGPDGTLNKVLEPLEHSVLDHADPAGQHAFIQEVLELLEHSLLDAAGPAGRLLLLALWARLGCCPNLTVTLLARLARMLQGGPVGPDGMLNKVLEPFGSGPC